MHGTEIFICLINIIVTDETFPSKTPITQFIKRNYKKHKSILHYSWINQLFLKKKHRKTDKTWVQHTILLITDYTTFRDENETYIFARSGFVQVSVAHQHFVTCPEAAWDAEFMLYKHINSAFLNRKKL
jgi:hypothetical protein